MAAQVWIAQIGRVPLLLLDSYVEENDPVLREVTDRLYGGGSEHRLRQELLLGIGWVRAVRAFCAITGHPAPEVFHTNEGHAGFLGLERIREYVAATLTFDEALELLIVDLEFRELQVGDLEGVQQILVLAVGVEDQRAVPVNDDQVVSQVGVGEFRGLVDLAVAQAIEGLLFGQ